MMRGPAVNPIRPSPTPVSQAHVTPKASDAARVAAQRAFFEIALGKASAAVPPQASAQAAPPRAAAPLDRTEKTPAEAPSRPLRPGSILDIRV